MASHKMRGHGHDRKRNLPLSGLVSLSISRWTCCRVSIGISRESKLAEWLSMTGGGMASYKYSYCIAISKCIIFNGQTRKIAGKKLYIRIKMKHIYRKYYNFIILSICTEDA